MLSSYRPVNGKTAFPNKRTRGSTWKRRFLVIHWIQSDSPGPLWDDSPSSPCSLSSLVELISRPAREALETLPDLRVEAAIIGKLDHRGILKIIPVAEKSRPYVVIEYLEGERLRVKAIGAIVLCFQSSATLPRSKSRVRIPCPALPFNDLAFAIHALTSKLHH